MDLSLDRFQKILIAAAMGVALACFYLITNDEWLVARLLKRSLDKPPMGQIVKSTNDTRVRYTGSLAWLPARQDTTLYQGQSLYVGPKSSLTFEMKMAQVELGENSLVRLGSVGEEIFLDLKMGETQVEMKEAQPLIPKTQTGTVKVKPQEPKTKINISRSKTTKELVVTSASKPVQVEKASIKTEFKPNQKTNIEPVKETVSISKMIEEATTPLPEPVIVPVPAEAAAPPLVETPSPPAAAPVEPEKILVHESPKVAMLPPESAIELPAPKPPVTEKPVVKPIEKPAPTIAEKKPASVPPVVEAPKPPPRPVYVLPAPKLMRPSNNANFVVVKSDGGAIDQTLFIRESVPEAASYEIQFARDQGFTTGVKLFKTNDPTFMINIRKSGSYFWRVRAKNAKGESPWSSSYAFEISSL